MVPRWATPLALLLGWAGVISIRIVPELASIERSRGTGKRAIGSTWDPRGMSELKRIGKSREAETFKNHVKRGLSTSMAWPGLQSAQISWEWLDVLQKVHQDESYDGDFSWMFSKIYGLIHRSPTGEMTNVLALTPYFFMMSRDHAGCSLILDETIRRVKNRSWRPWFWGGYHALENLHDNGLGADLFKRASLVPDAPGYLPDLAARLFIQTLDSSARGGEEQNDRLSEFFPPELLPSLKARRPDLFPESK